MARILIVDDETLIREWLEMCIMEYGIEKKDIYQANNGEDAYAIVKELAPEIIFTDITMPKIDGLEFIKNVRNIDNKVEIVILTCHDNFEFARNAVKNNVSDYLLKNELTKEDVINLLAKINKRITMDNSKKMDDLKLIDREQYLRGIVKLEEKRLISPKELLEYHVYLEDSAYISITFAYNRQVINVLNFDNIEYLKNPILFVNSTSDIVLITNLIGEKNEFTYFIRKLNSKIKDICGENTNVGYSRVYYHTQDLAYAINEAIKMREYLFFSPQNGNGFKRDQNLDTKTRKENVIKYKNEIISSYALTGKEPTFILVQKFFEYLKKEKLFDAHFIKTIFIEIAETIYNQIDGENIDKKLYTERIINVANVDELKTCIEEFFELIKDEDRLSESISEALQYINNNYYKTLSLSELAGKAFLSEEYFCRLFKKEVGTSYTKYLNNLRMKKAKDMVCSMKLNINEIAIMVGIPNSAYFSSQFKKYYGISPSRMRDKILSK